LFIGVSLKDQFEFIVREWANDGLLGPGEGADGTLSVPRYNASL
jgi:hypothetical protein